MIPEAGVPGTSKIANALEKNVC